jgi:hypothetical protein
MIVVKGTVQAPEPIGAFLYIGEAADWAADQPLPILKKLLKPIKNASDFKIADGLLSFGPVMRDTAGIAAEPFEDD